MAKNAFFSNTDRIYLASFVGFRKSTIGKIMAGLLGRKFVDLDEVIVQKTGLAIPEFLRPGIEEVFREMETGTAARFTTGQWIVALGGGTPVTPRGQRQGVFLCPVDLGFRRSDTGTGSGPTLPEDKE